MRKVLAGVLLGIGAICLIALMVMIVLSAYHGYAVNIVSPPAIWRNAVIVVVGILTLWSGYFLLRHKNRGV